MATQVTGGGDILDAAFGSVPTWETRQWLGQQQEQVMSTLSDAGRQFLEHSRNLYQTISESSAMQLLRNLRLKTDSHPAIDGVQVLRSLADIQTANPTMQRWIMAQPDIRKRYLEQTCEGYEDTYVNYHGDAVGETHYEWRNVMDGVVQLGEDDTSYRIQHFLEHQGEDARLSLTEKLDILNTWDLVKHYLGEGGEDPTSIYGNSL